jgi:hypothetical protein
MPTSVSARARPHRPHPKGAPYAEIQQVFADELPFTYLSTGDNAIAWIPRS